MTSPTRSGHVGTYTEYHRDGRRLAADGEETIDQMVRYSAQYPGTYHRYRGTNGYVTWAHGGREIDPGSLPLPLRDLAS